MLLTTKQACIYSGVSKPTFLKANLPYSVGKKKSYKMYDTNVLDAHFTDAPKILPSVEEKVGAPAPPLIELIIEDHQSTFTAILAKVKEVQGNRYESAIAASLIEDYIKSSVAAAYFFELLQANPNNKDIFTMFKQSSELKMNISKRLGL